MTPAEVTLPPGCLLYQANSSDRLEFDQLRRQSGFPQFLVLGLWVSLVYLFLLVLILGISGLLFPLSKNYFAILFGLVTIWISLLSGIILSLLTNSNRFNSSDLWLIKCHGQLVAWGRLSRDINGSNIDVLFVVKTWRRRGLGSALVKRLIQESTPPLSLGCRSKLVPFYKRLGFVPSRSNIFGGQYMVYKGLDFKPRRNQP